ncbi:MAG: ATP-binding protein [Sharpea porci]
MYKSILRYFITVTLISMVITLGLSFALLSSSMLSNTEKEMGYSVRLISHSIDYKGNLISQIEELAPFAYSDQTRISIIDKNGTVLADTYKSIISENHLHREEVQEALHQKNHYGYAIRKSDTTRERMLYVAYFNGTRIIRLSMPYHSIFEYASVIAPAILFSAIISFAISFIMSRKLARHVTKPLDELVDALNNMTDDFRFELKEYDYEEVETITSTLENLTHRLRKSMRETAFERDKQDEIISQMREGFILLDENGCILTINKAARKILGNLEEKQSFIEHVTHPELLEALRSEEKHLHIEMPIGDYYYRCYISNLPFGEALFFVDITMVHNATKMREDFFSSVSHELKTPITSIRGYTELLSAGVITDEVKQKEVLTKILDQVRNMSNLINDILMLSRLDSRDLLVEEVPLHIKTTVENVLENYDASIIKKNIHVHTDLEDVIYIGNDQQIQTLISNLVSNAVKYNKENGDLNISLHEANDHMIIVVADTGIGIPSGDQSRVFERFYRVDKGRSRALGGTGLGLAIVKHIVSYYDGTIQLRSQLDVGTQITISLPMKKAS